MKRIFHALGLVLSLLAIAEPSAAQLSGGGGVSITRALVSNTLVVAFGCTTPNGTGGASVGITYFSRQYDELFIGVNAVIINFGFTLSNKGSSVGAFCLQGFPHRCANDAADACGCTLLATGMAAGRNEPLQGGLAPNSTGMVVSYRVTGNEVFLADTDLTNTTYIKGSCAYVTN